jgi:hypothetical protein
MLIFAPANKMEEFFRDNEKRSKDGNYLNDGRFTTPTAWNYLAHHYRWDEVG